MGHHSQALDEFYHVDTMAHLGGASLVQKHQNNNILALWYSFEVKSKAKSSDTIQHHHGGVKLLQKYWKSILGGAYLVQKHQNNDF